MNNAQVVSLNTRPSLHQGDKKDGLPTTSGSVFLAPRYGTQWNEERAFHQSFWTPAKDWDPISATEECPAHLCTMLFMGGATPAHIAKPMGNSAEIFLRVYLKWLDDRHGDLKQAKLERFIRQTAPATPQSTQQGTS